MIVWLNECTTQACKKKMKSLATQTLNCNISTNQYYLGVFILWCLATVGRPVPLLPLVLPPLPFLAAIICWIPGGLGAQLGLPWFGTGFNCCVLLLVLLRLLELLLLLSRSIDDDDDIFVVCDILLNNDDLLGAIIVFDELIDIPFVVGLSDVEWLNVWVGI